MLQYSVPVLFTRLFWLILTGICYSLIYSYFIVINSQVDQMFVWVIMGHPPVCSCSISHSFFPLLSVFQHNVSTRILLCRDSVVWGMSTELLTKTDVYYLNKFWVAYNLACQLFWHLCIIVCLTTSNLTGMVTVMHSAFIWLFLSNGIFYAELYWPLHCQLLNSGFTL